MQKMLKQDFTLQKKKVKKVIGIMKDELCGKS